MRLGGLLVAAVLLAVLAGLIYWSNQAGTGDDAPKDQIVGIPEERIRRVEIRRPGSEPVVLERAQDQEWTITSPRVLPVDRFSANSLVSTVATLSPDRVVEESAVNWADFGLQNPPLEVLVSADDGAQRRILIGDETPTSGAYFARRAGEDRLITISSPSRASLDRTVTDLRDKRLLRIDSEDITSVELRTRGQVMEFAKAGESGWQILRPQPYRGDALRIQELVRRIGDARMESAAEEDGRKAAAVFPGAQRVATARVTTPSGAEELEVRRTGDGAYYARSSMTEGVWPIGSDIGAGLEKNLEEFRNRKLFDFGWNEPERLELRDGDRQMVLTREGEGWKSGDKEMDSATVQNVIDKLRDLSAARFAEGTPSVPVIEAAVVWAKGEAGDKVRISKGAAGYVAHREGERTLYVLEEQPVRDLQQAIADVRERSSESEKQP